MIDMQLNITTPPPSDGKKQPETVTHRLWDEDMSQQDQEAVAMIVEHLITTGSRPRVDASGDIIEIITAITNTLRQCIPSHLSHPLKQMTDYIAQWLCDYVDETRATRLHIQFGFDALTNPSGGHTS